jgi:microsomal dipeptidase-like Zn-dependent dipeptidase
MTSGHEPAGEKVNVGVRSIAFFLVLVLSGMPSRAAGPSERARALYESSIVLLAHTHNFQADDLDRMRRAGITGAVLKLTVDGIDFDRASRKRVPLAASDTRWGSRFSERLEALERLASTPGGKVLIVKTGDDIPKAKREGKFAAIVGAEGSNQIDGGPHGTDLDALRSSIRLLHGRGWRETQLRWNTNRFFDAKRDTLNPLGEQVLGALVETGVLVDVSHLSAAAVAQVLGRVPSAPLVRSHDTPASFGGESTDPVILDVARSGGGKGVFAVHFYQDYYGKVVPPGGRPTVNQAVAAIRYVVNVLDAHGFAGIDHVAIGADYFAEDGHWALEVDHLPALVEKLTEARFSDDDIRKVLGGNLIALYGSAWKR